MSVYFAKELENMPIYVAGHPVKFSCLKTEDQFLITELRKAAKAGIGGVYELADEAAYQECLKKKNEQQLRDDSRRWQSQVLPQHQVAHHPPFRQQGGRAAVAGGNQQGQPLPDPLTVPDPKVFTMPTVGKLPS